ncbi:MAG: GIY-YIG nuclease family protein [Patescibacteria group bacterium]
MYYVYILINYSQTFYIGVINNLIRRIYEHKQDLIVGFTKKYNIKNLVYYELYSDIKNAIEREKQLKHWNRAWKIELIKKSNPTFKDLYTEII